MGEKSFGSDPSDTQFVGSPWSSAECSWENFSAPRTGWAVNAAALGKGPAKSSLSRLVGVWDRGVEVVLECQPLQWIGYVRWFSHQHIPLYPLAGGMFMNEWRLSKCSDFWAL